MPPIPSWSSRLVLALLALQLASACDPNPPPVTPPADSTPPSTRVTPQGGTFKDHVSVTLLCEDGTGSGCDATYYTTDGSTPTASSPRYLAAVALTQNTTVKFFSADKAGNAEAVQSQAFVVDSVAPTTTATPAGGAYNAPQSIVLACEDGTGSGCAATHYTTDGSEPTTSSPRYTTAISITATTTLKFFSVDKAGISELVRTEQYTFESVAPTTTATPVGGLYNAAQSVVLACTDGGGSGCAATYYTRDGSEPTRSSPVFPDGHPPHRQHHAEVLLRGQGRQRRAREDRGVHPRLDGPDTTATPAGGLTTSSPVRAAGLLGRRGQRLRGHALHAGRLHADDELAALHRGPLHLRQHHAEVLLRGHRRQPRAHPHRALRDRPAAPTTTAPPAGGVYNARQNVALLR